MLCCVFVTFFAFSLHFCSKYDILHLGDYMANLGIKLRNYRTSLRLSLHQVMELTGITNSRLSKMEREEIICPALDLMKLAKVYNVPIVSLYLDAGYLSPSDLPEYSSEFSGLSLLDEDEKKHIQDEINFLNRKKVI